jgi:peptide/nickel transport system substrate-binding protein
MQAIVSNDGGVVIPMFASYVMAHSDAIAHPDEVGANWTLDGFRAIERWWFA